MFNIICHIVLILWISESVRYINHIIYLIDVMFYDCNVYLYHGGWKSFVF